VTLEAEVPETNAVVDNTRSAYLQVRAAILSGELEPGSTVSQVQLAGRLSVSRTPLREALRLLENEGLVESDFNRRVRIKPLSMRDLEALTAMRLTAEPLGVRLTVPQLTDGDLESIAQAMNELHVVEGATGDVIAAAHCRFHFLLFSHTESRLRRHIEDLWEHAERYRLLYLDDGGDRRARIALAVREHEAIFAAAEQRDGALAGKRIAEHIARTALTVIGSVNVAHEPLVVREAMRFVLDGAPADDRA
jgi:DNA-binding GntR family transcriptional regulator